MRTWSMAWATLGPRSRQQDIVTCWAVLRSASFSLFLLLAFLSTAVPHHCARLSCLPPAAAEPLGIRLYYACLYNTMAFCGLHAACWVLGSQHISLESWATVVRADVKAGDGCLMSTLEPVDIIWEGGS